MKTGPPHNQLCLEHKSCPVLSTPQWFPLNKIHQAIGPQPLSHLIHSLLSSLYSTTLAFWLFFEQTKLLFTGSLPVLLALDLRFPPPSRATLSSASLRFTLPVTVLSFKRPSLKPHRKEDFPHILSASYILLFNIYNLWLNYSLVYFLPYNTPHTLQEYKLHEARSH